MSRPSVVSRWVSFLDVSELGTSLALVRVLIGTCVLRTFASVWWSGTYDAAWREALHGGWRLRLDTDWRWDLLGGLTPFTRDVMTGLTLLAAVLLTLGVGGAVVARLVALVCLQGFLALTDLNSHAGGSYDALIANVLWLMVLAGPSRTLSVECRRATGAWTSDRTVMRWPRFLVVVQAVLMYGTTGLQKLSDHWVPGGDLGALWYILQQPTWQATDLVLPAWMFPLTQVGTLVTWLWEVGAPLWLWAWVASIDPAQAGRVGRLLVRVRLREVFLLLGVVFHAFVAASMEIGPFSWASFALYPAFIHPWEWSARANSVLVSRGSTGSTDDGAGASVEGRIA